MCLGYINEQGALSQDTLGLIDKSHRARLDRLLEARELRRRTWQSLRADMEEYARSICEQVKLHLWSSDSRLAFRGSEHFLHLILHQRFVQSKQAMANY